MKQHNIDLLNLHKKIGLLSSIKNHFEYFLND